MHLQHLLNLLYTFIIMIATTSLPTSKTQNIQHGDQCVCLICLKEQEIQNMRRDKFKMNLNSIYKNDYARRLRAENKEYHVNSSRVMGARVDYLDLQSTYGKEYINKKSDLIKNKPVDNLGGKTDSLPATSTYMKSYQTTLTPKPDEPFVRAEMEISSNSYQFHGQSNYQKAFNRENHEKVVRPSLPSICQKRIRHTQSFSDYESTQKRSYSTLDPQAREKGKKPKECIVYSPPFVHNYDTTYKNNYAVNANTSQSPKQHQHLDELNLLYKLRPRPFIF